jgi:hypothetical protein
MFISNVERLHATDAMLSNPLSSCVQFSTAILAIPENFCIPSLLKTFSKVRLQTLMTKAQPSSFTEYRILRNDIGCLVDYFIIIIKDVTVGNLILV